MLAGSTRTFNDHGGRPTGSPPGWVNSNQTNRSRDVLLMTSTEQQHCVLAVRTALADLGSQPRSISMNTTRDRNCSGIPAGAATSLKPAAR
jgi:hypothetical protein